MNSNLCNEVIFLTTLIEQCPDNSVVEMQCNWTDTSFSDFELQELRLNNVNTLLDCKTERQKEVLKSYSLDNFKYKATKYNGFDIWNGGLNIIIKSENKDKVIDLLKVNFDCADVCHCNIFSGYKQIAECYDSFMTTFLDNSIFKYSEIEKQQFSENDIEIDFR